MYMGVIDLLRSMVSYLDMFVYLYYATQEGGTRVLVQLSCDALCYHA
jgi:hypothetical protein